jgi:hypothetical protein
MPKRKTTGTALPAAKIEIDFVILGDFAQAVAGKLNLVGGGWNVHNPKQYPSDLLFGLGVGILVPWNEANRVHRFEFVIKGSEGLTELLRGGGEFEVGRPPGIPAGMTQRVVVGISGPLKIPEPGSYEVVVKVGEAEKHVTFEALRTRASS